MKHILIALPALLLAACADNTTDILEQPSAAADQQPQEVTFATYMGKAKSTRAGAYGAIDTEVLIQPGYGFGVFAYKTGTATYHDFRTQDAVTRRYPNFMYNEPIVFDLATQKWVYADPQNTKYWPNEVENPYVDDQNHDSGNDRATTDYQNGGNVSFFAYAPYVEEDGKQSNPGIMRQPLKGNDDGGILFFSTSNFNGGKPDAEELMARYKFSDPYVYYKLARESNKQVDLLWGTTIGSSENVLTHGIQPGVSSETYPDFYNDGTEIRNDYTDPNNPIIVRPVFNVAADLTKQKTLGTVNILFKHALSKIGGAYVGNYDGSDEDASTPTNGLMVILDIDKDGYEWGGSLYPYAEGPTAQTPYNTKVTINEIILQSEKQLTDQGLYAIENDLPFDYASGEYTAYLHNTGLLNLVTGVWSNTAADQYAGGQTIRYHSIEPSEDNGGVVDQSRDAILNANIAEPTAFTTQPYTRERYEELPVGVTTIAKNVYQSDAMPFVFIPGTHPIITITVDYTVRSYDKKLADNYTEVRQRITKRLYILDIIELNKQYNILIHLGLTSVKFTATVDEWEVTNANAETTTDPGNGESVVQTYDESVEHVWVPINVADIFTSSLTSIADFSATEGTRDLGIVTFTYDDQTTHDSREEAMTYQILPAGTTGASVTVNYDDKAADYGHIKLTLPRNDTPDDIIYALVITYGDHSKTYHVLVKGRTLNNLSLFDTNVDPNGETKEIGKVHLFFNDGTYTTTADTDVIVTAIGCTAQKDSEGNVTATFAPNDTNVDKTYTLRFWFKNQYIDRTFTQHPKQKND